MTIFALPGNWSGQQQDLRSAVLHRQECERQLRAALATSSTPGLVLTHAERSRIRHCMQFLARALDVEDATLNQISQRHAASITLTKGNAAK
ncbi:hypothetical protein [Acetobacter sp.]|uniref:hypothetical protein n=1 Tax=Acetobacter sp. TaxID=440 RepID=UPI0039E99CDB